MSSAKQMSLTKNLTINVDNLEEENNKSSSKKSEHNNNDDT